MKYHTPDLQDAVIARSLKDADNEFETEQMQDLSEKELMDMTPHLPLVRASNVMDVFMKWSIKKLTLAVP